MSQPPNTPEGSDPTVQYQPGVAQPAWPDPTAQPSSAQPYSGQASYSGQPQSGQPYSGQPYADQPYGAQPYSGPNPAPTTQPYPPQQYPPQPYPGTAQAPYPSTQPAYAYPGAPPAYPPQPGYAAVDAWGRPLSDKSKVVAGVLGIALGGFGVGRFYTGHTSIGVAQLLVTIFTCGLGHFWGLIDGIMILANGGTDAQGRILRD
jgi:TM2 domain-containing membrane protein YozV